eukprot:242591_1
MAVNETEPLDAKILSNGPKSDETSTEAVTVGTVQSQTASLETANSTETAVVGTETKLVGNGPSMVDTTSNESALENEAVINGKSQKETANIIASEIVDVVTVAAMSPAHIKPGTATDVGTVSKSKTATKPEITTDSETATNPETATEREAADIATAPSDSGRTKIDTDDPDDIPLNTGNPKVKPSSDDPKAKPSSANPKVKPSSDDPKAKPSSANPKVKPS